MTDNYKAIVGKLRLVPVEGANTLQIALYNGLTFAVDKSYTEDKLYLIFPPDGQLSEQYALANDLIRRKNPETGIEEGGFFAQNRKVRSISLMKGKIKSVGFIASLESLNFTNGDSFKLTEGDEISEFNGIPICNKYISPATLRERGKGKGKNKVKIQRDYSAIIGLDEHQNTSQFYRSQSVFEFGDLVTVTLKMDGTSVRYANAYLKKKDTWFSRIFGKLLDINPFKIRHITGTRRVLLNPDKPLEKPGYYGKNDMYLELGRKIGENLLPGESIYAEVVGWIDEKRPLFTRGGVKFLYNQPPGTREQYVYAIKHTAQNGYSYQLPWNLVKARCTELGLKTVPELVSTFAFSGHFSMIEAIAEDLMEGPDPLDNSHIREGIVFRIDKMNQNQTFFVKAKSAAYYALEDASKNDDTFVDMEEIQEVAEVIE